MTGYDLINEIGDLTKLLNSSVAAYSRRGKEFAQAEYEYRAALAQEIAKLRAEGNPRYHRARHGPRGQAGGPAAAG